MEKNLIIERLDLIERVMKSAASEPEYFFLLGMKEALMPLRYILDLINVKRGESENE